MNSSVFFRNTVKTINLCKKNKNKNEAKLYKNYNN